jgi:hypothetical protein
MSRPARHPRLRIRVDTIIISGNIGGITDVVISRAGGRGGILRSKGVSQSDRGKE